MKEHAKRLLPLLLALCLLLTAAVLYSSAATIVDSGTCGDQGDNLKWTLDSDGLLTISGTGKMCSYDRIPWSANRVKKVVINNGVTRIGGAAFSGCAGLTSVTIPDSVKSIFGSAFRGCTGLTSVTIPDSVTFMGDSVFSGCTGLTRVNISDIKSWCGISFTNIGGNPLFYAHHLYLNGKEVTDLTIPDGVTRIGKEAFYGCTGIISVTIPDSVTSIGSSAFYDTAWYNAQPDGLVYTGKWAYKYKGEMPDNTKINIKAGTLGIADVAFYKCDGLTSVTIPNSVTSIGDSAFSGCTGLTSVTIPNSVTSIGNFSFSGCSDLRDVYFTGNKSIWIKIAIGIYNEPLTSASIHYMEGYKVNYNANGGKDAPDPQFKVKGLDLTLSSKLPSKTCKISYVPNGGKLSETGKEVSAVFDVWNTAADGTGVSYAAGSFYVIDKDLTLYAQWRNPKAGALAVPTREGYTFVGWFTAVSGGKQVNKDTEIKADTILYAVWAAFLPGDVSGDGEVTAEDARLALRAAVGLETYAAGSTQFLAADATKDGAITAEDARLILRAAVGLETLA